MSEYSTDWKNQTLSDICLKINDGTHVSPKSKKGTRLYLTAKNIRNRQVDLSTASYISEEEHRVIYKRCPLIKGDLLFTKDGSVGNIAISPFQEEVSLLSSIAVLKVDPSICNPQYVLQWIDSNAFQSVIKQRLTGTAVPRLTLEKIYKLPISYPPLPEQKKIAEILSGIDNASEKLKGKKAKYQSLLVSMRQEIFNEEGAIIYRFDEIVLERVLGTTRRGEGTRDSIPLIKMGDILRGNIKIGDNERIENGEDLNALLLQRGDIIFNTRNTPALVGKTAIYNSDLRCTYDNNLMRIRVVPNVDSWYLNHLMNSPQFLQLLSRITAGTTSVAAIYWNDLRRLNISLPSIARQRQSAKSIESILSVISNLETKIRCLDDLKNATSFALLSGRKRVNI